MSLKNLTLIILVSILLSLTAAGVKPFYSKGEPREALVAQAMLNTGDWILPKRYDADFATKPPFVHWLMALSAGTSEGLSELSARLPSLLFSLFAVLALYQFISKRVSSEIGLATALVLLCSIEWQRAAATARVDMVLSSSIVLALLSLYRWHENSFRGFPWLGLMGMTAGFLTKGPVALVLPTVIFASYCYLQRMSLKKLFFITLLISVPTAVLSSFWYVAAYSKGGAEFLNTVLLENVARFQGTMETGEDPHTHSAFYLYGTVLLGFLPFTLVFIPLSKIYFSRILKNLKSFRFRCAIEKFHSIEPVSKYSLLITIIYLIFFSIPSSKRSVYLLPIYPFLSYLFVAFLAKQTSHFPSIIKFLSNTMSCLLLLAYTLLGVFSLINLDSFFSTYRKLEELKFYQGVLITALNSSSYIEITILLVSFFLIGLLLTRNFFNPPSVKNGAFLLFSSYILFLTSANLILLPELTKQLSAKSFAEEIRKAVEPNKPVFGFRARYYGLNFYLNGQLKVLEAPLNEPSSYYVVLEQSQMAFFLNSLPSPLTTLEVVKSRNPIEKPSNFLTLYKITPK